MITLTPRQLEVARLIHDGMRYKAIAHALGISEKTVKIHAVLGAAKLPGRGAANVKLTRYYERCYGEFAGPTQFSVN